jgi:hypothetical protein
VTSDKFQYSGTPSFIVFSCFRGRISVFSL